MQFIQGAIDQSVSGKISVAFEVIYYFWLYVKKKCTYGELDKEVDALWVGGAKKFQMGILLIGYGEDIGCGGAYQRREFALSLG